MIINRPRGHPTPRERVGAPSGFKCHYFYWFFLKSPIRYKLDISFDWQEYRYILSKSKNLKYIVYRKNSHSWYLIRLDIKSVDVCIMHYNKSYEIINYLEKELYKNDI